MRAKLLLLGVASLSLLAGCTYANSEPEATNALPATTVEPAQPAAPDTTNVIAEAEAPRGQVVSAPFTPPENVKLSPAATEIAKMAGSGVASSVMLSYVANSVNTYNLAADEIVYLNDLGVHPDVVSAMIQHDQQIREASVNGAVAAAPATPAPGASVWSAGNVTAESNVWQETAAAPAAEADIQTTVPPPPAEERPAEVTVNYFYDSLAPYGTWIDIDGYGRCWRPTVAVTYSGWRPYLNAGRWLWTDCGWYWYSDYSWGWAPFHYGRWFSHPYWGWCWMPGTIWGPSWVSWRYTDAYCGWAPLPPAACYAPGFGFSYYGRSCGVGFSFGLTWDCFSFVSYGNFCGRYYDRHRVDRHESARLYNNSTVINNVIVGDNNTIINQGISPDRITSVTRTEIPRASVRPLPTDAQIIGGRRETLAADSSAVAVTRNEVPGSRPPARGGSMPAVSATTVATSPSSATPTAGAPGRAGVARPISSTEPSRSASPTTRSSAASASPATASAPAAMASTSPPKRPAAATRSEGTRPTGKLVIREGQVTSAPTRTSATAASTRPTTSSATPWLNNSPTATAAPTTRPSASTWQSNVRNNSQSTYTPNRPSRSDNPSGVNSQPSTAASPQPRTRDSVSGSTPSRTIIIRQSNSSWNQPTRVQPTPAPVSRPWVNSTPSVRSTPSYSPPASTPAPARPTYSQPAPVPRSAPVVIPRSAPAPAPSIQSAPARPAAPIQRSSPPSGGNSDWGSRPGRPGR